MHQSTLSPQTSFLGILLRLATLEATSPIRGTATPAACPLRQSFDVQEQVLLLWAGSQLRATEQPFLEAAGAVVEANADKYSPQDLGMACSALTAMGIQDAGALTAVGRASASCLEDFGNRVKTPSLRHSARSPALLPGPGIKSVLLTCIWPRCDGHLKFAPAQHGESCQ